MAHWKATLPTLFSPRGDQTVFTDKNVSAKTANALNGTKINDFGRQTNTLRMPEETIPLCIQMPRQLPSINPHGNHSIR